MPCVKGIFDRESKQILLRVYIGNPHTLKVKRDRAGDIESDKDLYPCDALIDTGATHSCITSQIAGALGIKSDGQIQVGGVHGSGKCNSYSVVLVIPEIRYVADGLSVCEVKFSPSKSYQAILGMDILTQGNFQFDFSGNFVFCV